MTLSWFGVNSTIAGLACMGELHLLVAVLMATSFTLAILGILIIAKKYHSNSMANQRAHWSFKIGCGRLPSNIALEQKLPQGRLFF